MWKSLGLAAAVTLAGPLPANLVSPAFEFPVRCRPGVSCEIQNYVDRDPSPAARDYRCGTRTYDKHNGTDIRVPDLRVQAAGVDVLAAKDGTVLGARDGVADISVRTTGPQAVAGKECGNGLVIAHAGGWQTQYCHMARGSLTVKRGDQVKAGQPLGQVGLSGLTEFPHLHFTVRHDGVDVDPFAAGDGAAGRCSSGASLWSPSVQARLTYRPRAVLNTGFASRVVTLQDVETGAAKDAAPAAGAPALVAYVRVLGLQAGDTQEAVLRDPSGAVLVEQRQPPVATSKAEYLSIFGRKRPVQGWRTGVYTATYTIRANDAVVLTQSFRITL